MGSSGGRAVASGTGLGAGALTFEVGRALRPAALRAPRQPLPALHGRRLPDPLSEGRCSVLWRKVPGPKRSKLAAAACGANWEVGSPKHGWASVPISRTPI